MINDVQRLVAGWMIATVIVIIALAFVILIFLWANRGR